MGYDGGIIKVKKCAIERARKLFPEKSFSEIYNIYLYTREFPDFYDFDEEETSEGIIDLNLNVFNEYFIKEKMENDECRLIDKDVYQSFSKWIENKVKTITLYDIATGKISEHQAEIYQRIYLTLQKENIDWNTEYIVFENNW